MGMGNTKGLWLVHLPSKILDHVRLLVVDGFRETETIHRRCRIDRPGLECIM